MARSMWKGFGLVLACLTLVGCGGNCREKTCADFNGSSARTFTKCYYGAGPIETTLIDPQGKTFYDCTDSPGDTCTEATVDAEFNYCAQ
jgi:hypothetical protein